MAIGLSDDFCRVAQTEGLDDYLVGLVARLGGLLGFRDLRNAESVAALEREEPIRRFRELALTLTHRREQKEEKKSSPLTSFAPFLEKLKLKR